MAADDKISVLVESQLPAYLADEGPNLVAFLKAYYEWMETSGQSTDALKSLQSNQDLDTTNLGQFYEYFRREVLSEFPEDVLANKRLLAKRIKDLYRAKGTRQSHRLLFRLLYNQEIDFLDPSEFILRASDGRWVKENSIRLGAPFSGNFDNLIGETVTGQTSGASGKVKNVLTTFESGIEVRELFLEDVVGEFVDLEVVSNSTNTISGKLVISIGPLSDVEFPDVRFTQGGTGHVEGDRVRFTSAFGSGANGIVVSTSDNAVTFQIRNGGSGYTTNAEISISGGVGFGGSFTITSISNTETIQLFEDTINSLKDTPIGFGPTYSANSGVVSAELAAANASTLLVDALGTTNGVFGTINSISVTSFGNYSELPTIVVEQPEVSVLENPDGSGGIKGLNAIIDPVRITGAITDVQVDNQGQNYRAIDTVTVQNLTRSSTQDAIGDPIISGIIEDPGKYVDTKGFLSWDNKLQDSYYYQEYSYVIKSQKAFKTYENLVKRLVHPAGTKLFGQIDIATEVDFRAAEIESEPFFQIDLLGSSPGITIPSTLTFGIHQLDMEIPIDLGIESTAIVPNTHSVIPIIAPETIASTAVVSNVNVLFVIGVDTSIGPDTVVNVEVLDFEFDLPSINSTAIIPTDTRLFLPGTGTVSISNNNVIDSYLGDPITEYLDNPVVTLGSPFAVLGNNTIFTVELVPGSIIEIEDQIPGLTANTIAVVNTIFSNTSLTMNEAYPGGNTDLAIFRYAP